MKRSRLVGVAMIAVAMLIVAASSFAQEWHPPEPVKGEKDWVQLKSGGEWIHGTIDLVRDLKMEFDSDDLDDLVLDWSDVAAFRSPRILTFVFTNERIVTGTSSMRDGIIRVTGANGNTSEFPRVELLSIIEGRPREINYWSAKASLGTTARAGNTDQVDLNTMVRIKREATRSRINLQYQGNFGEVSGERTNDNQRVNLDWSAFVSRRIFITPTAFEYYADQFQNIDDRYTISVGTGYYLFRQGNIDWSVGLGGGYTETRFLSVEPGQDEKEATGTVIPTTVLEWDVTGDVEWDLDYNSQIGVPDYRQTTHHVTTVLTIDFFRDIFELSTSFTWDRVESPKQNADGLTPQRDDFRLVFGFGVDL